MNATLSLAKRELLSLARVPFKGAVQSATRSTDHFQHFSEFLGAVVNAGQRGEQHSLDVRLRDLQASVPGTAGNESSGADGGFSVPPQFAANVLTAIVQDDSLLMQTDLRTIKGASLAIPVDKTTPWDQTHGIIVRWEGELADLSGIASKPQISVETLRPKKIVALVPMTDELIADSIAAAEHVGAKIPDKIQFATEKAIISGSGVGQPLGITNSKGTVTVAKESGQAAATIVTNNVTKLWNAVTPSARKHGTWIIHPDADLQLQTLTLSGGSDARAIYQPPTATAPFGSLLGRPIYISEASPAVGTPGDIIFGDLGQYITAMRAPRYASSVHVLFDYDMEELRFVLRIDGAPSSQALFPSLNGSAQCGFFAMLAQR